MEEFVMFLMGAFGTAWIVWVLFCIIMVVLWFILPIFVIMMNSKLKKINQNLVYIAEGKNPPKKRWDGFPDPKIDPVKTWLDKDNDDSNIEVIDLTDVVEK